MTKKFKNTIFYSLLSAICCFMLMNHFTLHADTISDNNGNISDNYVSKAFISFKGGTGTTEPVDPTNPGHPAPSDRDIDPGDPGNRGTGSKGPLTIDYAPNFNFGNNEISSYTKSYNLNDAIDDKGVNTEHHPFVQVTDKRGTHEGWSLSAVASNFVSENGEQLRGAQLSIKSLDGEAIGGYDNNPSSEGYDASSVHAPTINPNTIVLSNNAQVLMNATSGTGAGTWLERFDPYNVQLRVIGNTAKANTSYTSNITWNLTSSPAN
ncbi:WxL domain-containing protein [Apilactobacillus ozensis]|uniref:WxL domain-containing protein n=1 Tax=Apilactobacillus ozensis TaxID=866801 RepID=UPI00200B3210|nr:WxL domain-containing protein [Apilactobacillus ozensis]MCK8607399.1 WxL domain-containing protein [Apilactobacillus ozensis]